MQSLSDLSFCNPFQPVRLKLEKEVLGRAWAPDTLHAWSRTEGENRRERVNIKRLNERATGLAEQLATELPPGVLSGADAYLLDDLATYTLYYRHVALLKPAQLSLPRDGGPLAAAWRALRDDRERLLRPIDPRRRAALGDTAHLFACLHQVRRAFYYIFGCIIGESAPATRLRADVWESIFTHDLRRYRRSLYGRMRDLATLVTGPSGSGKELVAQAIGRSQYRAFDPRTEAMAGADHHDGFVALNLSALSPTLIESELFGHRKGAFTGAAEDRVGWLERCPEYGAVMLDEIGELDPTLQVKLLRVAQSRDFSRLGESRPRRFAGKLIAATNRDLAQEVHAGRFREDLYYRLCSDRVTAPSLHEQLADRPKALAGLVRFLCGRVLGDADASNEEVDRLAEDVLRVIRQHLPTGYAWPGNIRELEQCIRSVLVRQSYQPLASQRQSPRGPVWLASAERGELTADALLSAYCRHVHQQTGGYEPAARVLGLDRRTVKSRVTPHPPANSGTQQPDSHPG